MMFQFYLSDVRDEQISVCRYVNNTTKRRDGSPCIFQALMEIDERMSEQQIGICSAD